MTFFAKSLKFFQKQQNLQRYCFLPISEKIIIEIVGFKNEFRPCNSKIMAIPWHTPNAEGSLMSSEKGKFLLWCTRLAVKDEFKLSGHIIKDVVYNREGQLTWFSPRLFLLQWLWPTLLNLKPKSLHLIWEFHPNLSGVKTKLSNDFAVLEFWKLPNLLTKNSFSTIIGHVFQNI